MTLWRAVVAAPTGGVVDVVAGGVDGGGVRGVRGGGPVPGVVVPHRPQVHKKFLTVVAGVAYHPDMTDDELKTTVTISDEPASEASAPATTITPGSTTAPAGTSTPTAVAP